MRSSSLKNRSVIGRRRLGAPFSYRTDSNLLLVTFVDSKTEFENFIHHFQQNFQSKLTTFKLAVEHGNRNPGRRAGLDPHCDWDGQAADGSETHPIQRPL